MVLIILAMLLSGLFVYMVIRNLRGDKNEEQLKDKAQTDALTGLLNRAAALERISHFIYGEGREWRHALMIIDLDGFKEINDTFGHLEGDRVLQAMAKKMQSILRPSDIIGRFGGDEFIVLVKYTETIDFARRHARKLVYALEYLCVCNGIPKTVTASMAALVQTGRRPSSSSSRRWTKRSTRRSCPEELISSTVTKSSERGRPINSWGAVPSGGGIRGPHTASDPHRHIDGGITGNWRGDSPIYHTVSFIRL